MATLKERAAEIEYRLTKLPIPVRDKIEREFNLSVPLVKMIGYDLIAGLTPEGKEALTELESELAGYEKLVSKVTL